MPLTSILLGQSYHPGGFDLTHDLAIQTLVNNDSIVLDIGIGACINANYLANRFNAQVFAIESSLDDIQQARHSHSNTLDKDVYLVQGDSEHLPMASDSVDVVFCEATMSTYKRREKVLAEIYRVLKPRGFLAISDVFLNITTGQRINKDFHHLLGVNSFFNAIRCEEVVSQSGFYQLRFKDVSSQLLETLHSIESKLAATNPKITQRLDELTRQQHANYSASQLANMIYNGDAGYYTLTARKPG